jgi:Reverse transcriptase (RNA-dependent DNA polymerase)
MGKLLERMVTSRLNWFLESNKLISNFQSGFRARRSVHDNIALLTDVINKALANRHRVVGVFLDFEKAYDMVWRRGVLLKLKNMGISGNMLAYIRGLLSGTHIHLKIKGILSHLMEIENGMLQGSSISPTLFLVMINDLTSKISSVSNLLFADGTTLFKSGSNLDHIISELQKALDNIALWCEAWGFRVSTAKSVVVPFGRTIFNIDSRLTFKGTPLPVAQEVKFLGIILDSHLNMSAHVSYIVSKCARRIALIKMVSGTSWGADSKSLLLIYKSLVRSVLLYGSAAYGGLSAYNIKKLESIQYNALRIISRAMKGIPSLDLTVYCGEMPIATQILEMQCRYFVKIKNSPDSAAASVACDHWANHYGLASKNSKTLVNSTLEFSPILDTLDVAPKKLASTPPWLLKAPCFNISLWGQGNKHQNPSDFAALTRDSMRPYDDHV